jgi:4'-phosphopantetheinyl transferase
MEHTRTPGYSFKLYSQTVYVWPVANVASKGILSRLEEILSEDEKARADRFRFDHLRQSFVVARGILRVLLGRYLGISPASVQFSYSATGKPSLAVSDWLDFNASHSGDLAVYAFTAQGAVGVDVEQVRPLTEMQDIAGRFFCFEEAAELMSLAPTERTHAFFLCWTRKEAYIKATGEGLSAPLDSFRVTLRPGQPARFIQQPAGAGWQLHDLKLDSNYAAAVAYHGKERAVIIVPASDPGHLIEHARTE